MTLSVIHRATIQNVSKTFSSGGVRANPTTEPRVDRGAGLRHFLLVGAAAAILAMAPAPAFAQHGGGHASGGGGGHSGGGFGFGGGHSSGGGSGGSHANGGSHGSGGTTHSGGTGVAEGGPAGSTGGNSARAGESGKSAANSNGGGHWWSGIFGGGHSNANSEHAAANTNANASAATGAWARSNVNVAEAARENAARKNALHANAAPAGAVFGNGVRLTTPSSANSLRSGPGMSMAPAQNNLRTTRGLFARPGGLNAAGGLAAHRAIGIAAAPRGHLQPRGYIYSPYYYNPFFFSGFGYCNFGYCGAGFGPGWGWGFGFGAGYYGFGGSYWNAACDPFWGCQGFGYNGWGYDNSANYNDTSNGSGDYTVDAGGQSQESNPGPYENPPADMNGDAQAGANAGGANAGASVSANANSSENGANSAATGGANAATPNAAAPNSGGQLFVLYMKDGSSYAVSDYWLGGGKLHYVTSYGGENTVDLAQLDVQKTVDVNAAAGRKFSLRAGPAN